MSSTVKASIVIGGSTKELDAAVDKAMGRLSGFAAKVAGLFAGVSAFNWGYDLLKQSEASEIAFTKLLGSADQAKETLAALADFAAKTPMDNASLRKAYQSLLSFKFAAEDIPGILRVIGDTASAMPGDMAENTNRLSIILGQMRSKAKLSAGEMLQLTEAGVNAWEYLRQALNLGSVAEVVAMSEKGAIDSATAVRAVLQGMEKDFNGLMEKRSQTVEGLISTIQDNVGRGLEGVFRGATGGDFKTWLSEFGEGLNGLGESGATVGERIAQAFQVVKNVFDGIHAVGSAIYDIMTVAFDAAGITDFGGQLSQLRTDFDLVKSIALGFVEAVATGFAYVGDAVSMYFISPIRAIVGVVQRALSDILGGFAYLADKLSTFSDTMGEVANKLRGISDSMEALGLENIRGAKADMGRGFTSPDAVAKFFDGVRNKPTAAGSPGDDAAFEKMAEEFWKIVDSSIDFNKSVANMASLSAKAGDEMVKLAKEAAEQRTKDAQKLMRDSRSPGEIFREELSDLSQMLADGLISKDAFNQAAANSFKSLADGLPGYSPNSAVMAGSAEAQRTINEARYGANRVEDILRQVEDETKRTRIANEEIVRQLERSQVIPVGVN